MVDGQKTTPLAIACINGYSHILSFLIDIIEKRYGKKKKMEEVRNLSLPGMGGDLPLDSCVRTGHIETVKILLSFKETDRSYGSGRSLLHYAVGEENLEMVKVILSDNCLLEDERKEYFNHHLYGMTPLEYAMEYGYHEITEVSYIFS